MRIVWLVETTHDHIVPGNMLVAQRTDVEHLFVLVWLDEGKLWAPRWISRLKN